MLNIFINQRKFISREKTFNYWRLLASFQMIFRIRKAMVSFIVVIESVT